MQGERKYTMDDEQQTESKSGQKEREKGADLEYDAQDEDALSKSPSEPVSNSKAQA
jgi:hypothetical protein